ncbi:hypothetical protein KFE25_006046 [Diacronema lutheri]|uniref:protein-tyrosine-phosphatase n=1 Tax=Diacronema lutheri TaxID=2081491 RepID=A0A8J5XV70_DIALT|nr:hypothetical protein KFE25_006046 [Diacronema lutheri]
MRDALPIRLPQLDPRLVPRHRIGDQPRVAGFAQPGRERWRAPAPPQRVPLPSQLKGRLGVAAPQAHPPLRLPSMSAPANIAASAASRVSALHAAPPGAVTRLPEPMTVRELVTLLRAAAARAVPFPLLLSVDGRYAAPVLLGSLPAPFVITRDMLAHLAPTAGASAGTRAQSAAAQAGAAAPRPHGLRRAYKRSIDVLLASIDASEPADLCGALTPPLSDAEDEGDGDSAPRSPPASSGTPSSSRALSRRASRTAALAGERVHADGARARASASPERRPSVPAVGLRVHERLRELSIAPTLQLGFVRSGAPLGTVVLYAAADAEIDPDAHEQAASFGFALLQSGRAQSARVLSVGAAQLLVELPLLDAPAFARAMRTGELSGRYADAASSYSYAPIERVLPLSPAALAPRLASRAGAGGGEARVGAHAGASAQQSMLTNATRDALHGADGDTAIVKAVEEAAGSTGGTADMVGGARAADGGAGSGDGGGGGGSGSGSMPTGGLYIGNFSAAEDHERLKRLGITAVLTVADNLDDLRPLPPSMQHLVLPVNDDDEDVSRFFSRALAFVCAAIVGSKSSALGGAGRPGRHGGASGEAASRGHPPLAQRPPFGVRAAGADAAGKRPAPAVPAHGTLAHGGVTCSPQRLLTDAQPGGAVLVHCAAGANRSATFVLAYLLSHERMTLRDAFAVLYAVRPIIGPHLPLCSRLLELELRLHGTNSIALWEMEPTLREATERLAFVVAAAQAAPAPHVRARAHVPAPATAGERAFLSSRVRVVIDAEGASIRDARSILADAPSSDDSAEGGERTLDVRLGVVGAAR